MPDELRLRRCPRCCGNGEGPFATNLEIVPCPTCEGAKTTGESRAAYHSLIDMVERTMRQEYKHRVSAIEYRNMLKKVDIRGALDKTVNWGILYASPDTDYKHVCGNKVPVFDACLQLADRFRGRSTGQLYWSVNGDESIVLPTGMDTTCQLLEKVLADPSSIVPGRGITGLWTFSKQGTSLFFEPVTSQTEWNIEDWEFPDVPEATQI